MIPCYGYDPIPYDLVCMIPRAGGFDSSLVCCADCCVLRAGRAADAPVEKDRILHGKQLAVLSTSLMPVLGARIYVHVNGKQQGGWVKENSLCNEGLV
jgi:hypothetical protein